MLLPIATSSGCIPCNADIEVTQRCEFSYNNQAPLLGEVYSGVSSKFLAPNYKSVILERDDKTDKNLKDDIPTIKWQTLLRILQKFDNSLDDTIQLLPNNRQANYSDLYCFIIVRIIRRCDYPEWVQKRKEQHHRGL